MDLHPKLIFPYLPLLILITFTSFNIMPINNHPTNTASSFLPVPFPLLPTISLPKMAWTCTASTHLSLIRNLQSANLLSNTSATNALKLVDRAFFVPSQFPPYADTPQPLPHSATISAPHMHAIALSALAPYAKPGCNALDVGAGSGYFSAAMAVLTGPNGHVVGVEHVPLLVQLANDNLSKWRDSLDPSLPSPASIDIRVQDGRDGASQDGPFCMIHVGAAAPVVPQQLLDQLAVGGAMVIPVGKPMGAQSLQLVRRTQDNAIVSSELCPVRYVPLCDLGKQLNS